MNKEEKKLIDTLIKYSTIQKGTVSTQKDSGIKYRYDSYIFKYKSAHTYIVNMFKKVAGVKKLIVIDDYSIYYDRPIFKGQPNGRFIMKKLIILG